MKIVIALGGNALLRRGEPLDAETQRGNVRLAAGSIAEVAREHTVVVTHGNGPQVGLLALQAEAYQGVRSYPLDLLGAESDGMIGYLLEQELTNLLPPERQCATLLTRIEVELADPAFAKPSKPIGPVYTAGEAERLRAERGWQLAADGPHFRRVVPSPQPRRITNLAVIELLLKESVIVICAGGGGIPTARRPDGSLAGVEAVIDKDLASALLARQTQADLLLMLTDVAAVYTDWRTPVAKALRRIGSTELARLEFEAGSMAPKVAAALDFVSLGGRAGIGALADAEAIIAGRAGTLISRETQPTQWWP